MHDSTPASDTGLMAGRWQQIDVLSPQEAAKFARTVRTTRHAQRQYMGSHIVSETTADEQIRQLVERFLQVGRLAREVSGTMVRARSPRADGEEPYSFLLDMETGHVISYRGPDTSWFDEVHVPLEDLLHRRAEQRRLQQEHQERRAVQEQQAQERRAAHEQRMREQQEAAAARRAALPPAWPTLPEGPYDRSGNPTSPPAPRRPITDETRIRHVGRLPHVTFHSDALNSPFFRDTPLENRCEALRRVLDVLLRAPSKGTVVVNSGAITVTGKKVTLTLTPDCAMVRTLNPPRPGNKNEPPLYRAKNWVKARERKQ